MYKIALNKRSFLKNICIYFLKFGGDLIWQTENYVKFGDDLI